MKKIALTLCSILMAAVAVAQYAAPNTIALTGEEEQFVKDNSNFAFRLFRQYRADNDRVGQSLVVSPLSITYALGMLNNGATGETQQQICDVLGGTSQHHDEDADATLGSAASCTGVINSFCRKMIDASGTLDENTKVLIANNIYLNEARGFHLLPDFVQTAAQYYDATPESRDFYDGQTRQVINQWASDHTEGMIPEPLKEDEFQANSISYLLNALYFKSEWTLPFDQTLTQKGQPFDGGKATADMMTQHEHFQYAENDLCQSIRLPYGNGAFQMSVFLPRPGKTIADVLDTMSGDDWDSMDYDYYMVNLKLPCFTTDTDQRLEAIMSALGMPRAFDPHNAQFDQFAANEQLPDVPIYISMMKQVAKICVNENGTEASAVTIIGMRDGASPETKYAEFIADRPFLYVISERSTGAILFMGQYMGEPAEESQPLKPMLVQRKTWQYTRHHFEEKEEPTGERYPEDFYDESTSEVSYTVQGDTVIDGRDYVKMYRSEGRGGSKYYGAFREDGQGRVWQYDLMGDKRDFMLCDVTCGSYPGTKEMAIADVISISGQLLHRYNWHGVIGVESVGLQGKGLIHYLYADEPDCICDYETLDYVMGGGLFFTAADFLAPKQIQLTEDERQLVEGNNAFAARLFQKARGDESTILSPLSITYALGMLNNGAAGLTQMEINNVLGSVAAGSPDAINAFCLKMMNELNTATLYDTSKASIANTIFVNQGRGYELQPDFAHQARHYYYASPESRDFADGETRQVINQWASDHTEGMIKEVLKEPEFDTMAVSYLLNAIYFKGLWTSPFRTEDTVEEPFAGGSPVPMMRQQLAGLLYAENDRCQTVVLPYGNGTYQMQVFLPREGVTLDQLLADGSSPLTAEGRLQHLYSCDVDVKLPRFATSTDIDLKRVMSALGMPTAFNPANADFSKLCVNTFGENIYIGQMKQVAKIDVSEEGTEAAAVTIIGEAATDVPRQATFHADRPFLYVISEQSTGIILFMGQYTGNDATDAILPPMQSVATEAQQPTPIYNLAGQRLQTPPTRGIYIRDGKKMLAE